MKRYQLFGFDQYYPSGGSGDIRAEAETIDELMAIHAKAIEKTRWLRCDEYEILDIQERCWLSDEEVGAALKQLPA